MRAVAIMIDDALAPRAAKCRLHAPRKDDRVLDRNDALVVIAVERPGLQLAPRQFAFVHQLVKWVAMMVSLRTDRAQARFELRRRQKRLFLDSSHRVNSIPSLATSQPASRTKRYSLLSSSRIGFVLLM